MINLLEAQELHGLIGGVMEGILVDEAYTKDNIIYKDLQRARELASVVISDIGNDRIRELEWVLSLPKDSIYGEVQDRIKLLNLAKGAI